MKRLVLTLILGAAASATAHSATPTGPFEFRLSRPDIETERVARATAALECQTYAERLTGMITVILTYKDGEVTAHCSGKAET